jgi:uncharacterized protein YjbI with pentapeptide repeats
MEVDDTENVIITILSGRPVPGCSEVIADVDFTGRLDAGKDSFLHLVNSSLESVSYRCSPGKKAGYTGRHEFRQKDLFAGTLQQARPDGRNDFGEDVRGMCVHRLRLFELPVRKMPFPHCTFGKCDLSNLNPMNSEFFDVKFNGCKAIGIDWTRALIFKDNSLTDCLVNYSNFRFRKMQGFVLKKCEAKEVDFIETDITGANFRHTDFENATFFKTNLTKADFTGAVNYGIDVTNNVLKEARFSLPEAFAAERTGIVIE